MEKEPTKVLHKTSKPPQPQEVVATNARLAAVPSEWADVAPVYFNYNEAESLPPIPSKNDLRDLLPSALLLIDNGDFENAERIFAFLYERHPGHPEVLKWRAYLLRQAGRSGEALEAYQRLAELEPSEESFFYLARSCYELEQLTLAKVFYEKSIQMATFDSAYLFESYKNLGNIHLKLGDIESAEENYDRAYTLMPHSDVLLVNYGTLGLQKGDLDLAQSRFQQAIDLNSNNDRAWIGMAFVQRRKGDHSLAWGTLLRGLDVNSSNLVGLHAAIEWSMEDQSYSVALERLQKYLLDNPGNQDLSYCEVGLLFKMGRIQESQEKALAHIRRFPQHAPGREILGIIEERLRR